MNKTILVAAFMMFGVSLMSAQITVGFTGGMSNVTIRSSVGGENDAANEIGFYAGVSFDYAASEKIDFRGQALYTFSLDTSFIQFPIRAKFKFGNSSYEGSGFNLQVGPQVSYIPGDISSRLKAVSAGVSGGLGYDINKTLFIEAIYALQLTNSLDIDDRTRRYDFFNVGIGFRID